MPNDEEQIKITPKTAEKRKWYKRGKVWLIIVVCILVLAGLSTYGWYLRRVSYARQMVSEGWHEISAQANKTVVLLGKVEDISSLNEASRELHSLDGLVSDKQFYASRVPTWLNDKEAIENYTKFLKEFGTYAALAASQSDDVTILQSDDYKKLEDSATIAKLAVADLKNSNNNLKDSISDEIYVIDKTLEKIAKAEQAKKLAEEKAKSEKQKQADKAELDQATVEVNVSKFMDGFISGDKEKMKRYMTDALEKEYDFNQLSAESRQYSYPASFRVVDNRNDGENYKVTVNVINKNHDSPNQYTSAVEYTVTFDEKQSSWLINAQKFI